MSLFDFKFLRVDYQRKRFVSVCAFGCLFLGSCAAGPKLGHVDKAPTYVHPELQKIGELPPYKTQVGDVLEIKFLYNDEFDQEIIVRPDGVISTTAAQSVKAAGRTPAEIAKDLNKEYLTHLREPNLSVMVKSFAPTQIFVLGEVQKPGEYTSLMPNPSLLQILSLAGDIKPSAESGQILIIRKNDVAEPVFYLASYDDVAEGVNPLADVQLTANDVVFVPKTGVAEVYQVYRQYIQQFGQGYRLE